MGDPVKSNVFDVIVFEAHDGIPKMEQVMWPRHCVQETWGSELHKNLKIHSKARLVHKGCNPDLGSRTIMVEDASKGVKEEDIQATFKKIRDHNGCVVDSSEVKAMVVGRDRRPELGYKLALQCRDTWPPKVPGKEASLEKEFKKL